MEEKVEGVEGIEKEVEEKEDFIREGAEGVNMWISRGAEGNSGRAKTIIPKTPCRTIMMQTKAFENTHTHTYVSTPGGCNLWTLPVFHRCSLKRILRLNKSDEAKNEEPHKRIKTDNS